MRTARILSLAITVFAAAFSAAAAEFWVSPGGNDANPGTADAPFRTVQHAASQLEPGDTCWMRGGTYRETVRIPRGGREAAPIRFSAAPGERVVLNGADIAEGPWERHQGAVYKTELEGPVTQVFLDGDMMVEARWPNMPFPDGLWRRDAWASAGEGSRYGKMVDPELAKTGVDWTGGCATLNVAHQFYTWTRTVESCDPATGTFTYAKDLTGITHYADKTKPWEDDQYFLSGKLGALDIPGEWFHDPATNTLYLWAPDGKSPEEHTVEVKRRNYAFAVEECDWIALDGLRFFATTVDFTRCDHCVVENCRFLFPTYVRRIADPGGGEPGVEQTRLNGSHNVVRRCSLAYTPVSGFSLSGLHNLVEECLIHDAGWYGSLHHAPLRVGSPDGQDGKGGSTIRRNTVHHFGNAGIVFYRQPHIVELNHVYDGGLCCEDVSLVYTQLPQCAGTVIRYNWVHGCQTRSGRGLGIRGDDQTRRLIVHHNVVWDCGMGGIIAKGDFNRVCNNTVFDIGTPVKPGNGIALHTRGEPKKPWRDQFPLLEQQNQNSDIYNNASCSITCDNKLTPFPESNRYTNNVLGNDLGLMDPDARDFRPAPGSGLIDAGREVPDITEAFSGTAPDIGAYESGAPAWTPGITWEPDPF